jgi:hypothetical protein
MCGGSKAPEPQTPAPAPAPPAPAAKAPELEEIEEEDGVKRGVVAKRRGRGSLLIPLGGTGQGAPTGLAVPT